MTPGAQGRGRQRALLTGALLALGAVLIAPACGEDPPVTAEEPAALPEPRTTVEGEWWVLAPSLPTHGLRLTLVRRDQDPQGAWEGSWLSFDWRGTDRPHLLARASRPVAVSAQRDHGGRLVVHGPVPQIDARGRPTGQQGRWQLVLEQVSLAGQPLRFSGSLARDGEAGVPVELTTTFRAWGP